MLRLVYLNKRLNLAVTSAVDGEQIGFPTRPAGTQCAAVIPKTSPGYPWMKILACEQAQALRLEKGEYLSSTSPHSPNPLPLGIPSKLCKYWEKEKIREKVAQVANLCHLSLPL